MPRDGWSWAEFGRTRHLVGLGWVVGWLVFYVIVLVLLILLIFNHSDSEPFILRDDLPMHLLVCFAQVLVTDWNPLTVYVWCLTLAALAW